LELQGLQMHDVNSGVNKHGGVKQSSKTSKLVGPRLTPLVGINCRESTAGQLCSQVLFWTGFPWCRRRGLSEEERVGTRFRDFVTRSHHGLFVQVCHTPTASLVLSSGQIAISFSLRGNKLLLRGRLWMNNLDHYPPMGLATHIC
jgi:hypothetical protein